MPPTPPSPSSPAAGTRRLRLLFVSSEARPLAKTGGLGDVSADLPAALRALGHDVRLLLPAYRPAMRRAQEAGGGLRVASLALQRDPEPVRLLAARLPGSNVPVWLADAWRFDREGGPYTGPDGADWPDNAERFALFARAAAAVARDEAGLGWRPDLVHANDWQSALACAYLAAGELEGRPRPATVFTIHNLAYQGLFPAEQFWRLGLPPAFWSADGLEFYGQCSYIKGGLVYADWLTTVSPTYAREIRTPEHGCLLDGLLRARADRLVGILNGADYRTWNPARDPHLAAPYSRRDLSGKAQDKAALQREAGLPVEPATPLMAMVTRLAAQKGVDLVLAAAPRLLADGAQLVVLGTGDRGLEEGLRELQRRFPQQARAWIAFDEGLAHRIEAGADLFLMPSRFEPCGLNQLYSLRYGTLPVVRRTGGLADTVVDLAEGEERATGFLFDEPTAEALAGAAGRALACYRERPQTWRRMVRNAMAQDFSWRRSAEAYVGLYRRALAARPAPRL